MLNDIDHYFLSKQEPVRSYLLALRQYILQFDPGITEDWKYGMPFYCYKNKMMCYLWVHKKTLQPYIGIVEGKRIDHPGLIQENRARMKIMLFDVDKNIPLASFKTLLKKTLVLYK